MSERFVSKRDAWLVAVLWTASLVDFGVAAWIVARSRAARPPSWRRCCSRRACSSSTCSTPRTTRVEGDALRIRASFFRWRVPLAAIDSIEPTRNPLSSPACSLDRLLIRYGERRVMISPLDKAGFLRVLAARGVASARATGS